MSEALDMPAAMARPPAKARPSKRKLITWAAMPVAGMALLCTVDIQTMGQQQAADCTSTQQAVAVPKPHIWLAGAITGVMDQPTAMRDVMAGSHPDVALTQVVAANPSMHLTPMGNVPPTYGGRACLTVPSVPTEKTSQATVTPKAVAPGKGG